MSVSYYEGRVKHFRREVARHGSKEAAETKKAAEAEGVAVREEQAAARTTSESQAKFKIRRAETKRNEAVTARKAASDATTKRTKAQTDLIDAEHKLERALAEERKRNDRRAEQQRQQLALRQRSDDEQREATIRGLQVRADRLEARVAANAPRNIIVLFIAANPDPEDPEDRQLQLEREVGEIQRRIRETEHREAISFQWRPATRTVDLLQILNEVRPHIVHFSGHGSEEALVFEDADGQPTFVRNDQLAMLLSSSSERIRLVVFNSCHSATHAEMACEHVEAAIGMDQPVDDEAAKFFAAQFYNSLGFGLSLERAFAQACTQMSLALGEVSGAPRLYTAHGVDAADVFLIAPPSDNVDHVHRDAIASG
jgi:CHAT domain-containing protein